MVTATVLGIYFVPVFFVLVYRFAMRGKNRLSGQGADDGSGSGNDSGPIDDDGCPQQDAAQKLAPEALSSANAPEVK